MRPTVIESVFSELHLDFKLGAFLAFLIMGPLGSFLFSYFVSFNLGDALYASAGLVPDSPYNLYSVTGTIFWYGFLIFVPYSIRYLRIKLMKAEPVLTSLSPDGEATVSRVFRFVSSITFQVGISIVFLAIYMTSLPDLLATGQVTALSGFVYFLRSLLRSMVFGSVLGLYCGALWGLYHFGRERLRLKTFRQDRLLGVKELGSLSFTFTSIYFVGLALFVIQAILGGMAGPVAVVNLLFMMFLPPLGVVLFLAPLVSTHHRMVEAKETEVTSLRELSGNIIGGAADADKTNADQYTKLLALEALERKASSIPTWPFATRMVGQLTSVVLSVFVLIIFRLIQIVFGF